MTHRSDDWRALLQEAHDVEQLSVEVTRQAARSGVVDGHLQHHYLVRRAALADRATALQSQSGFALAGEVDAGLAALGLLKWDREHGTGRGLVAAADPRWDADPLRYVHQEHTALVLDGQEQPPG
ncbi:hypothetical protein [Streptomyces lunaelactis]|uniref:hypothetical protein n=1 Tax=Streptomyces lunaelactis TaxID=1535768 RepID=UPI001585B395|nr:hypothetical protein [Streptomyces lunaelactis]NUK19812.1 hypothetical protein [Streptomyces lunaelactis]